MINDLKNKYNVKMKGRIINFAAFGLLLFLLSNNALASSSLPAHSLGSSIIIPNHEVFILGKKIKSPEEKIVIEINKPILFGYTLSNVKINLIIRSENSKTQDIKITASDNNGYWNYSFDEELKNDTYKIFMVISDVNNISSEMTLIGTFEICENLPKVLGAFDNKTFISPFSLNSLNYLTVPLIICSVVIFMVIFYLFIRRINIIEE